MTKLIMIKLTLVNLITTKLTLPNDWLQMTITSD